MDVSDFKHIKDIEGGKMRSSLFLTAAAMMCIVGLALFGSVCNAEEAVDSVLTGNDCVKCHSTIVGQVDKAGYRHKTDVACLECHDGQHPPGTEKGALIPQCSMCHEGDPHFTLDNCSGCHSNPHQPLDIVFEGDTKAACNTCHSTQVDEVTVHPSAHAEVDCAFCHDKHKYKPDCMNCHDPHVDVQKYADCVKCHQVHQPLQLAYGTDIPNRDCGACHDDIRTSLESGANKHAALQCVFCHADKHAFIPECQVCHERPHSEQMVSKFKGCNDCHRSAHNLLK